MQQATPTHSVPPTPSAEPRSLEEVASTRRLRTPTPTPTQPPCQPTRGKRTSEDARLHASRATSQPPPVASRTRSHTTPLEPPCLPTPAPHTSEDTPVASRTRSQAVSVHTPLPLPLPSVVPQRALEEATAQHPETHTFDKAEGLFKVKCCDSRVLCCRRWWRHLTLQSLARRLRVGMSISCVFRLAQKLVQWNGVVMKRLKSTALVDYQDHGTHTFPPLREYRVHRLTIHSCEEVEKLQRRLSTCHPGDILVHKFTRKGEISTWRGRVMIKLHGCVKVKYDDYHGLLTFPAPSIAQVDTTKWFTIPQSRSSTCKPPSAMEKPAVEGHGIEVCSTSPVTLKVSKKSLKRTSLKLLSWNSRTLKGHWRHSELLVFLITRQIDIACLQETRWNEHSVLDFPDYTIYKTHAIKGVGGTAILVHNSIPVLSVTIHGNIIAIEVQWGSKGSMTIICAYAPHRHHSEEVRMTWWGTLDALVAEVTLKHALDTHPHPIMSLGDFNSERYKDTYLEDFCSTQDWLVMNECFTKKKKNRITFNGTNRREAVLDCVALARRWRSCITDVHAVPPPTPSDHKALLVTATFKVSRTVQAKKLQAKARRDWSQLTTPLGAAFSTEVNSYLARAACDGLQWLNAIADCANPGTPSWTTQLPTTYSQFASACRDASYVVAAPRPPPQPPPGHTYLVALYDLYTHYNLHPLTLAPFAPCTPHQGSARVSFEQIREPLRAFQAHAKIHATYTEEDRLEATRLIGLFRTLQPYEAWKQLNNLVRKDKTKSMPTKSTPASITAFFTKINGQPKPDLPAPTYRSRLLQIVVRTGHFDSTEFDAAVRSMNRNKATGVDDIPTEVLKVPAFAALLLTYANDYYDGTIPPELLLTRLCLVPKKGDLSVVDNYRGIALTSVFLKLINRMLLNRLRALEPFLRYNQNGFRAARGTSEQGLAMKFIADAMKDGLPLAIAFVDFSKAFDSVTFDGVKAALAAFLVPAHMITVIMQCYTNHIQMIPSIGAQWRVETGVLQGDTLAPFLFVLLVDCILDASLDPTIGLNLTTSNPPTHLPRSARLRAQASDPDRYLTDLDYADDLALCILPHGDNIQRQLQNLERGAAAVNLKLNVGPNKTEIIAPNSDHTPVTLLDGRIVEYTHKYTYLGQQPFDPVTEFTKRKGTCWRIIHKFDDLWKSTSAPFSLKHSLLQTLAISAFTHGSHLWPATAEFKRTIDGAYATMIRYCTWSPGQRSSRDMSHHQIYRFGKVPLLSSIVLLHRIRTLGHALRHDQALVRCVIGDFYPPIRRDTTGLAPRARSSIQQLVIDTGLPRDDWYAAAQHRDQWYALGQHAAYLNEQQCWEAYGRKTLARWTAVPRLLNKTLLRIAEVTAQTLIPPVPLLYSHTKTARVTYPRTHNAYDAHSSPPRINLQSPTRPVRILRRNPPPPT